MENGIDIKYEKLNVIIFQNERLYEVFSHCELTLTLLTKVFKNKKFLKYFFDTRKKTFMIINYFKEI